MTFTLRDAGGAATALKSRLDGGEHVIKHDIDGPLPTGTNSIGKVVIDPGTNLGGAMRTYAEAGTLYIGGVAYTVKRALFDTLGPGGLTLVPAVVGKKLRVLGLHADYAFDSAVAGALSTLQIIELTSGLPVLSPIYLPSTLETWEINLPFNEHGYGETYTNNLGLGTVLTSFTGTKVLTGEVLYLEF